MDEGEQQGVSTTGKRQGEKNTEREKEPLILTIARFSNFFHNSGRNETKNICSTRENDKRKSKARVF